MNRSQGYGAMRELHKAYGKCAPEPLGPPDNEGQCVGACSCGRLFVNAKCWGRLTGKTAATPWVHMNHATKRKLRQRAEFKDLLKRRQKKCGQIN